MYGKVTELKRLTRLLESIGQVKDYPAVRNEADRLNHFAYSLKIGPAEAQKGIVQHLEKLPDFLNDLKDRARREHKKEAYELLTARIEDEIDLFTLIEVWKNWDRSKEVIYSLDGYFIYWGGVVRRAIIFTNPASDPGSRSKAIDRFEAKVDEVLPKPRITPEDYEVLLRELEAVVREWREATIAPERRERVDNILLNAEAWITELDVLSLLDS